MGALGDLAALQEQFHAQLAALGALQEGRVPPENTVLAACGGKIPLAAVSARHRRSTAADPAARVALYCSLYLQQSAAWKCCTQAVTSTCFCFVCAHPCRQPNWPRQPLPTVSSRPLRWLHLALPLPTLKRGSCSRKVPWVPAQASNQPQAAAAAVSFQRQVSRHCCGGVPAAGWPWAQPWPVCPQRMSGSFSNLWTALLPFSAPLSACLATHTLSRCRPPAGRAAAAGDS